MKFLFLGDFLYDYDLIRDDIRSIGAELEKRGAAVVLNLEAPLKSPMPRKKWINLCNSDKVAEVLKILNTLAVNIANNHILDWGRQGLEDLIRLLEENGIPFFGAGLNLQQALSPVLLKVDGKSIGFLGFGWKEEMCIYAGKKRPGVAPLKLPIILDSVRKLKEEADLVAVNLHWGYEYEQLPLPVHRQIAHRLVDEGADLIIGHHPHVIQAFESYKGRHIYYSLGNFYFGSLRDSFDSGAYGLGVLYDPDSGKADFFHVAYENGVSRIISGPALKDISGIQEEQYNHFFRCARTSSRKPSLYTGKWHRLINPLKLMLNRCKEKVFIGLIRLLERFHMYDFLKAQYRKRRKG